MVIGTVNSSTMALQDTMSVIWTLFLWCHSIQHRHKILLSYSI